MINSVKKFFNVLKTVKRKSKFLQLERKKSAVGQGRTERGEVGVKIFKGLLLMTPLVNQ